MNRFGVVVIATLLTFGVEAPFDALLAQDKQVVVRLTLADAINRGFETSHRLAEVRAREAGARAAARSAEVSKLPIVSVNGSYTRTNHVEEFAFPQPDGSRLVVYPDLPDNLVTRFGFQWPIYTSGRTDALERSAEAEVSAVAADIEAARADLRFEIARAYWAAATAREAVRVLEESALRVQAQLNDANQRFKVGLIPPNEVFSLEAQRSREQAQFIEARNLFEGAQIDLKRLVGVERGAVIELAEPLEREYLSPKQLDTGALIAAALQSRPERQALSLRLGGLQARQQAAQTGNRPTVSAFGGVDYGNPNLRHFPRQDKVQRSWDIGVNFNWNFVDFGRSNAQVAEAAAAVSATRERIAELDEVIAADVEQRLLDLQSSEAMVRAAADAIKSAAEARRIVGDRFNAGVATSTDVLVAQVALLDSEMARTRALAAQRLAEARLERSIGRW
jgi:outer membrane protein TolC